MIREEARGLIRLCVPDLADGVVREVFDEDCYRVAEIPERSYVVDVGAHIGCFSLRCASERGCLVTAYEPNPLTFGFLVASVAASGLEERVRCTLSAVGPENGPVPFYVNRSHPASSELYGMNHPETVYERISVPCLTIDQVELPREGRLVLKLDCESAEGDILVDVYIDTIRRFDVIVGEWHNYDGARYRDYLKAIGFDVELRGGGVPQPAWDPSFSGGLIYARRR